MKILIVSDPYYPYPSGVTEYVHNLAKFLRKFKHEVDIVATSFDRKEDKKYDAIRVGRVFYLPFSGSYATLPVGWEVPAKMRDIVERSGYDVIHLNGPLFPNLSFYALKYSKTKTVATFHSALGKKIRFGRNIFHKLFGKYYAKLAAKIAVSRAAMLTYQPYIPGDYKIIPNGVDTERFSLKGETFPKMKEENSILFLGRLDPRKGLDRLLHAFVYVKEKVNNVSLKVVGKGPLEKTYKKLAVELGIDKEVSFEGYGKIEDIPRYFRSAKLYTSPATRGESFGIVLIEAMACGCPVVASDIEGYREVINSPKDGILVDTKDPLEYADTIVEVLRNEKLRNSLIKEGLKKVKEKFSWEKVAREIENLYKEI